MRKIFLLSVITLATIPTYAQNEIYKCVDSAGSVIYSNDPKVGVCEKTGLGKIDKGTIVNKNISNENPVVSRENRRTQILQGELTQEKKQLQSISEMLKNSTDIEQKKKLEDMESMHKRNVAALNKELGSKANVELLLPGSIGSPNNSPTLPISLPNEDKKSEGIMSQVFGFFKPNNKEAANNTNNQTTIVKEQLTEVDAEQPFRMTGVAVVADEEPKRVTLETNLITNKSLKSNKKKEQK